MTLTALAIAVTVTAYIPANSTGALMTPVLPGLTCAVSRDPAHLKGHWIHVKGHGPRFVNDLTHKRLKRRIDLPVNNMVEAREIALQKSEIAQVRGGDVCREVIARTRKPVDFL